MALAPHSSTDAAEPPSFGEFKDVGRPLSREDKDSWDLWKWAMNSRLITRKLSQITLGQEPKPIDRDSPAYALWQEKDEAAKDQIVGNLSDELADYVRSETTAAGIWTKIVAIFDAPDRAQQESLVRRYNELRYVDGSSMRSYLIKLDVTRRDLKKQQIDITDENHAHRLYSHLPPSWSNTALICSMFRRSPSEVKRVLLEEEEIRVRREPLPGAPAAEPQAYHPVFHYQFHGQPLAVPASGSHHAPGIPGVREPRIVLSKAERRSLQHLLENSRVSQAVCTHCGRRGHRASKCRVPGGAHYVPGWNQ